MQLQLFLDKCSDQDKCIIRKYHVIVNINNKIKISLMMRTKTILLFLLLMLPICSYSQGTGNKFPYDETDFEFLFSELGLSTFKFPIKQNKNQILDFLIEEYKEGTLISSKSVFEDTKNSFKEYGLDPTYYFEAKKDSVYFHRCYFHMYEDSLKIVVKTHGVTTVTNIKIPGNPTFSFRAVDDIQSKIDSLGQLEIPVQKDLLFLYANSPLDKSPLWCPSGLSRESVIKKFYYVLYISAKNITTDK
jgi:hypothetical protein